MGANVLSKAVTQYFGRRTIWDGRLRSPIYYHLVGVSINGYLSVSFRDSLLIFQGLIDNRINWIFLEHKPESDEVS